MIKRRWMDGQKQVKGASRLTNFSSQFPPQPVLQVGSSATICTISRPIWQPRPQLIRTPLFLAPYGRAISGCGCRGRAGSGCDESFTHQLCKLLVLPRSLHSESTRHALRVRQQGQPGEAPGGRHLRTPRRDVLQPSLACQGSGLWPVLHSMRSISAPCARGLLCWCVLDA